MPTKTTVYEDSWLANADLRTHKNKFVKLVDSSGTAKLALAAAGELAIGVLTFGGNTNEACTVQVYGRAQVLAGGAIAAADLIKSDANGKAAVAVKGNTKTDDAGAAADPLLGSYVIAQAEETAGAADILITVLLKHLGAVPTTAS